ncbi:MAG: hypothetical protein UW69_C0056G0005 [Microgenomates group bacterium GW2011_GWA2_44_7]|nr:MAG: hypothetical protein UW69_C0056G0005 [Microgenomates group bacterium GW2011_GWA2_44_7]KKT77780.1 MAG: hypothetical protein UW73_C0012G0022 [Microgenomates group bacterium GW2011_GWB1_44_8]
MDKTALFEVIQSKTDLQEVLNQIDELIASLYQQKDPKSMPEAFVQLAQSRKVDLNNPEQAESFFLGLKKELTQIPQLGLTLAFAPSKEYITALSNWVHTNVGKNLILDITVDESILGGTTISFNGHYKDLSLNKALDEEYQNNRELFTGRLKAN